MTLIQKASSKKEDSLLKGCSECMVMTMRMTANNELPCLHRSETVMLQQLSLPKQNKNCTGFSELSLVTAFRDDKTSKKQRPPGCCDSKSSPSYVTTCAEISSKISDFCECDTNSTLLPAWSGLCVYLCISL